MKWTTVQNETYQDFKLIIWVSIMLSVSHTHTHTREFPYRNLYNRYETLTAKIFILPWIHRCQSIVFFHFHGPFLSFYTICIYIACKQFAE